MKYLELYENYESGDWADRAVDILQSLTGYNWTLEKVRPGGTASFDEWRPNTAWLSGGDEEVAKRRLEEAGIKTDHLSFIDGTVLCVDLEQMTANEDMSYTDFFGKKVSHDEALEKRLCDLITYIIEDEEKISEMDWTCTEWAMQEAKGIVEDDKEAMKKAQEYYDSGKRLNLLAENMYAMYRELNSERHKPEPGSEEYKKFQKRIDDFRKKYNADK
jgi:hypothetical protein